MAGEVDMQTETATLLDNGEIEVLVVTGDDETIGHGGFVLKPGDPEYAEYKARFELLEAGDWKTIDRRLVDGKWVGLPPRPGADLSSADPTEGKLI